MTKEDKNAEAGTPTWLRTTTILLTVLTPVINNLASRLADRLEQGGRDAEEREQDVQDAVQEKVAATRQSLRGTVRDLKEQPYSQELLKRGEGLAEELQNLVERGSTLSQSLIARGSDLTSDLAERGSKASQELARRSEEIRKEMRKRGKKLNKRLSKRSEQVAKELRKRSDRAAKELRKRARQATRQNANRSGLFWIIAGFTVGLSAAGTLAFILIRQRVQQQRQLAEEQSIEVIQDSYLDDDDSPTIKFPAITGLPRAEVQPAPAEAGVPTVAVQENAAPAEAAFVGVVGTRRYYPISTPLDQLSTNGKTDVVYFTTEDEAQVEGYTSGV